MGHLLDLVTENLGHLRIDVVGAELSVEQPGAFVGRFDDTVKAFLTQAQAFFEFLLVEERLHLFLGDGQPDVEGRDVERFWQEVVGSRRQYSSQVGRLPRRGRDHDENSVTVRL